MKTIIKNKRGGLTDLFIFIIMSFVLAIFCVVMVFVATKTYDALLEHADAIQKVLPNDNATQIIQGTFGKVPNAYTTLKWVSFAIIVGMALSILISSFLVRVNAVFFVPYVLIVIIAVIVSVPVSNTYEKIYQDPTLASSFTGFYGQTYIFLNFPIWVAVIGILAGIIMFVNMLRTSQYGGYA